MNRTENWLYKKDGSVAGLKDVMRWFIDTYPKDIFTSPHPVHQFRNWAIEQLKGEKKC